MSGPCARNLEEDIRAIRAWGAARVVTLMEDRELDLLHVGNLGRIVKMSGMKWHHFKVIDQSPLSLAGVAKNIDPWKCHCAVLLAALKKGEKIFVHCRGGLGRTGVLAARLLVEIGLPPARAIREVRAARPGAIENMAQERYILDKFWK